MNKDDLLRHIAETAYNVGFGAKKHFATYDIVAKAPGLISFFSLSFGVFALVFDELNVKYYSATLIVLGVAVLYISFYNSQKHEYKSTGQKLTDLFNELKPLYNTVKSADIPLDEQLKKLVEIEKKHTEISNTHQILFSNWYAHYKFFWEQQIGWIDEQLHFKFFKDKIPLSLMIVTFILIVAVGFCTTDLINYICSTNKS